jgi:proteic killer suppression protein
MRRIRGRNSFRAIRIYEIGCCAVRNTLHWESWMIRSFRHKGLRHFYETGSTSGIQSKHAKRLQAILTALEVTIVIDDMRDPSFRLHPLKGEQRGRWSVWVNENWRVTFEFHDKNVHVIDYEDYH